VKKAQITQSNYIPWKGYFDSIAAVDAFVVYDDMQYTKRDWRNRNYIKTDAGLKWLSIPVEVKGKFHQKIKETKVSNNEWRQSHLGQLKQAYRSAACFDEYWPLIERWYAECNYKYLTEINVHFISKICAQLGINTDIRFSSEMDLAEDRTERLVSICKQIGASSYYSGPAAKNYMDESMFEAAGIDLNYWDYSNYKPYPQVHGQFEHGVSILDMFFNLGDRTKDYLKFA
jgi:hypothetical protein